ncbi:MULTISPECIES: DUF3027 domain-containing protein [Mycolicibacter]|uniref:DUF3027 domain-containing protein n=1 Tax=Mycolicibacter virginiensis TaxID=1795032 RepID=A0A9X7IJE2_9MYCO|nr:MULTISPECIES: DUF3027 domain-containing protein [Mycobacteriaceae]OBJ31407.1 hypothetical protein A5631_12240 [Mycolicibacter heraklionensis]PQM50337.1 DUF3027 domain-containing protein [Mycolicibacter virginiensis]ULP48383.1 DUF3027 domain-containing protein [Mycolicibacter virginiensis]
MTGPSAESATATIAVPTVLAEAVEQARSAVAEFSGADTVGEHLGVDYEDPTAATHRFGAVLPGYQGWQWAVVVAAIPGATEPTVSEVVLVPGPTALLAPEWVPWDQRVRPGDLGPGDLLAPPADDPRLVPGYTSSGDPQLDEVAGEIGLGRRWLMSPVGRAEAAQRWHDGEYGPDSAMARSTKRVCRDCGFYLPLAGELGTVFGVCGNEMSADGHVVDNRYGCGAHSDTPAPAGTGSPAYEPYDDGVLEIVDVATVPAAEVTEPAEAETETGAEVTEDVAEPVRPVAEGEAETEAVEAVVEAESEVPAVTAAAPEPAETGTDAEADAAETVIEASADIPDAPGEAEEPGEPETS